MAVGLKSVFKNPSWLLRFKALVYAAALFWVWLGAAEGELLPLFAFLFVASFFYFSSLSRAILLLPSFILIVVLSLVAARLTVAAVLAGFLFYVLIALKDYFFVNRQTWHFVLNFTVAAWAGVSAFIFPEYLPLLGLAYFLLLYEAVRSLSVTANFLFGFVGATILYQIAWALSLLPIGFASQAALAALFYYVGRELMTAYTAKQFLNVYALRLATIALLVSTAVFLVSDWAI